ncbi:MAG: prolipoprotein diacylglyceryl transferase [Clostridiales bacterium]|nr:prolipoprotein diacylglyceryl transferase [Clostridiales bacterium]
MFPDTTILGLSLYEIFLTAGVISALVVFRVLSDKTRLDTRLFNFCLIAGVVAIISGYGSSVVFQAFYNYAATGVFEITASTGTTFYGGLIGGAAVFLLIYFVAGHFAFRDRLHVDEFYRVAGIAACCITTAHSLGRVGCLMAGCCHGIASETFGIYMAYPGYKAIPTQLYEALFLALLSVWFVTRVLKGKSYNFPLYMITYGIWRFFIEYLRGDERGATFVSFLSPSQLTAIILILGGLVFWYAESRSAAGAGRVVGDRGKA